MQHLYSSCHVFVRNNRYEWPPSLFLFLSNISLIKLLTDTHKFTNGSSYIKNESTKHLQFINKWVICLCWHLRIYHQSKVCKLHFLKNCKIVNFQQDCQFIQDVKLWIVFLKIKKNIWIKWEKKSTMFSTHPYYILEVPFECQNTWHALVHVYNALNNCNTHFMFTFNTVTMILYLYQLII